MTGLRTVVVDDEQLARDGFHCLALDGRGHGDSAWQDADEMEMGNGLETARFAELAPLPFNGRLHLLFIGYMGEHKGVPVLLKALTQLPCARLHVDFVGDGWACAEYQQFLQRELQR